jgi:hypothetical protein
MIIMKKTEREDLTGERRLKELKADRLKERTERDVETHGRVSV